MLVPSADSNMDSERLASAHRAEGTAAPPATASSRPAMTCFDMHSALRLLERGPSERDVVRRLAWRKTQHWHFIRAFDAMSRFAMVDVNAEARPQPARHPGCAARGRQRCARSP